MSWPPGQLTSRKYEPTREIECLQSGLQMPLMASQAAFQAKVDTSWLLIQQARSILNSCRFWLYHFSLKTLHDVE